MHSVSVFAVLFIFLLSVDLSGCYYTPLVFPAVCRIIQCRGSRIRFCAEKESILTVDKSEKSDKWSQLSPIWADVVLPAIETSQHEEKAIPLGAKINRLSARVNEERKESHLTTEHSLTTVHDFVLKCEKLSDFHEDRVLAIWKTCRRKGSRVRLSEEDNSLVLSALKLAYISLSSKRVDRSQEIGINCAVGTVNVLSEMCRTRHHYLNMVVATFLSHVFANTPKNVSLCIEQSIRNKFGDDSIILAKQYASLPNAPPANTIYSPEQVENQIEMLTVLAENSSLLSIRIAERLHTMRVLSSLPLETSHRRRLAEEALFVYATLAHRMNLINHCSELENLSFQFLEPSLSEQIEAVRVKAIDVCKIIRKRLSSMFLDDEFIRSHNASLKISSRVKSAFQLSLKMRRKELVHPELVRDLLGLRIVVNCPRRKQEIAEDHFQRGIDVCYYIGNRLQELTDYSNDMAHKDFIRNFKTSGYQSLHYHMIDKNSKFHMEVQVRTKTMDLKAEFGEAAHWFYKDLLIFPLLARSKLYRKAWRSTRQLQATKFDSIFGLARKQIAANRVLVYCDDKFTVVNMRQGATVLDAAFAIHSNLGLITVSAKLNDFEVPLNTSLRSGDVVSVQPSTCGEIVAQISWLEFLKTPHAISTLRKYFRESHRSAVIIIGLLRVFYAMVHNHVPIKITSNQIHDRQKFVKLVKDRLGMSLIVFLEELGVRGSQSNALMSRLFGTETFPLDLTQIVNWALDSDFDIGEWEVRNKFIFSLAEQLDQEEPSLCVCSQWGLLIQN